MRNQFDIQLTPVADVINGQTDLPYQSEHHALTKQNMRYNLFSSWQLRHAYISSLFCLIFCGCNHCLALM